MTSNYIEHPLGVRVTYGDGQERLVTKDFFTSNYSWRDLIQGYELTTQERQNFDYYDDNEILEQTFFRYKGEVYDLGDFMRIPSDSYLAYFGWQGSLATSVWSATLIKLSSDGEQVMIAQINWTDFHPLKI